ncbi:MAG: class II aldolase/adducin family protein, partial [Rhodospirillales bacterium]|nr:class II aldolase/adducin family protein [Rhodospirillales bacterium]
MSLPPRDLVAWLYRSVAEHRLITGSAGNVSLRHGEGMLITPTGATGATARPARMVEMRFDGNHQGKVLPSSEWQMHAAIYRAAPQAMAIVHTHSDCATALACLGEPLPAFHYDVAGFGGTTVPLAAYATFGTAELAANVVRA